MLNPNFGAINGTLKNFGINTESLTWTASPRLALLVGDRGRRLAMDTFCLSGFARRLASNSAGALRGGAD